MARKKLVDLFDGLTPKTKESQVEGILSAVQFGKILQRERSRSDRSGLFFSVLSIVLDARTGKVGDLPLPELLDFLERRVRTTDTVGWLDSDHIGVLLPDTPESGAWKLAEDVCRQVSATIPGLICQVYTYPAPQNANGSGNLTTASDMDSQPRNDVPNVTSVSDNFSFNGFKKEYRARGPNGAVRSGKDDLSTNSWTIEPFLVSGIPLWKRLLDITGSIFCLVMLSPLFLLIAAFIKVVSPGPVFYRQVRIGYLGRPFNFWKFRTMRVDNSCDSHMDHVKKLIQSDTPMVKLDDHKDSRIIPFGSFLRKTCLDELPQLFNVLIGEMSLVGPRPCLPYEAAEYHRWHARRFDSLPGMTGLWQVSGKNRMTFKEMVRLDIQYERHMSPWLDLKILLKTVPAIISMATERTQPQKESLDAGPA